MKAFFVAVMLAASAATASADTIYSYTGDHFAVWPTNPSSVSGVYTTADRITGSFAVPDGFLPPLAQGGRIFTDHVLTYSFTDGHQTLTSANSMGDFRLTLAAPDVQQLWLIDVHTPTSFIVSSFIQGRYDRGYLDENNQGINSSCFIDGCDGSHAGTWTVSVSEPTSLILALAGLAFVGWRMKP